MRQIPVSYGGRRIGLRLALWTFGFTSNMASLPNYLRTHRYRHRLSQEEVGYLMGGNGTGKGSKVSLDENSKRETRLRTAMAYEILFGTPIRELFAGAYEEVQQEVMERAKLMQHRANMKANTKKLAFITTIIDRIKG
jgi:transcriptional regulator with XRE-family HTH domain